MEKLSNLPNIGKILEQQLLQVGIATPEQLKQVGSKQAWLDIKAIDPSACYSRLCARAQFRGSGGISLATISKKSLKNFMTASNVNL